ncbi:MAG: hypothetical protein FJY80_13625, partial [Candidatus Aminicenantes bacterium]|nr:hypothetical protein [Candidatus Aminicenantes bacterium]
MRRPAAWFLTLAILAGSAVSANLRAPRRLDGVFSGALASPQISSQIRLLAERLDLVFPAVDLSRPNPRDTVRVTAAYEFESAAEGRIILPVRFLALDLADVSVELNGRPLAAETVESPEDKADCLAALGKHREEFLPAFYGSFLGRLKGAGPDLGGVPFGSVFERAFEAPLEADFPASEIDLGLEPGKSTLVVSYRQRLFIEERDHGYFAAWPRRGFSGFDYLLYPARSWPADPGFRLSVTAEIPDVRAKKLFFRVFRRPFWKSNLAFREEYGQDGRRLRLRGEF